MVYFQQKATLYIDNKNITKFTRQANNTKNGK